MACSSGLKVRTIFQDEHVWRVCCEGFSWRHCDTVAFFSCSLTNRFYYIKHNITKSIYNLNALTLGDVVSAAGGDPSDAGPSDIYIFHITLGICSSCNRAVWELTEGDATAVREGTTGEFGRPVMCEGSSLKIPSEVLIFSCWVTLATARLQAQFVTRRVTPSRFFIGRTA